jgi:hypothetical protein
MNDQPTRPEPDEATLAEIAALNDDQRAILEDVLAHHPALSHKEALEHLKAAGL